MLRTTLAIFAVAAGILAGCDEPGRDNAGEPPPKLTSPAAWSSFPPGSTVELDVDDERGRSHTAENVEARGAAITTAAAELAQQFSSESPSAMLPGGGGALGGSSRSKLTATTPEGLARNPFVWAAIVAAAGAAWLGYRGRVRPALALAAFAAAMLCAAVYPAAAVIVGLGGGGLLLYDYLAQAEAHGANREGLRALNEAVETAGPNVNAIVDGQLLGHAEARDRAIIEKARQRDQQRPIGQRPT
jgi:hypothetical protein